MPDENGNAALQQENRPLGIRASGDEVHSGDALEFKIGNRFVLGRVGYQTGWVVMFPDARFRLMPEWVYPVRVQ